MKITVTMKILWMSCCDKWAAPVLCKPWLEPTILYLVLCIAFYYWCCVFCVLYCVFCVLYYVFCALLCVFVYLLLCIWVFGIVQTLAWTQQISARCKSSSDNEVIDAEETVAKIQYWGRQMQMHLFENCCTQCFKSEIVALFFYKLGPSKQVTNCFGVYDDMSHLFLMIWWGNLF